MRTFALVGFGILLGAAACGPELVTDTFAAPPPVQVAPQKRVTDAVVPTSSRALIEDERNTIEVFEAASRATVFVTQTQVVRDWSRGLVEVPSGTGSGFLWDAEGHVVTNYHVVDGGRHFTVTLHNGETYPAKLVGGEPRKDIAVLAIDAPNEKLVGIRLPATDAPLRVGQKAIAIGNPFGLDNTLTVGVISALGRDVEGFGGVTIQDMVQTDASINPGNSGGPLLDSAGQLIGMNTMIFSQSGSSAGIGFAVPTPTIRRIVTQILETGHPRRVGIGVQLVPDHLARRQGIRGVIIQSVQPGSPAAEAGMQGLQRTARGLLLGDVIVGIEGKTIEDFDDLYTTLDPREPGEVVEVTVVRGRERRALRVKLIEVR